MDSLQQAPTSNLQDPYKAEGNLPLKAQPPIVDQQQTSLQPDYSIISKPMTDKTREVIQSFVNPTTLADGTEKPAVITSDQASQILIKKGYDEASIASVFNKTNMPNFINDVPTVPTGESKQTLALSQSLSQYVGKVIAAGKNQITTTAVLKSITGQIISNKYLSTDYKKQANETNQFVLKTLKDNGINAVGVNELGEVVVEDKKGQRYYYDSSTIQDLSSYKTEVTAGIVGAAAAAAITDKYMVAAPLPARLAADAVGGLIGGMVGTMGGSYLDKVSNALELGYKLDNAATIKQITDAGNWDAVFTILGAGVGAFIGGTIVIGGKTIKGAPGLLKTVIDKVDVHNLAGAMDSAMRLTGNNEGKSFRLVNLFRRSSNKKTLQQELSATEVGKINEFLGVAGNPNAISKEGKITTGKQVESAIDVMIRHEPALLNTVAKASKEGSGGILTLKDVEKRSKIYYDYVESNTNEFVGSMINTSLKRSEGEVKNYYGMVKDVGVALTQDQGNIHYFDMRELIDSTKSIANTLGTLQREPFDSFIARLQQIGGIDTLKYLKERKITAAEQAFGNVKGKAQADAKRAETSVNIGQNNIAKHTKILGNQDIKKAELTAKLAQHKDNIYALRIEKKQASTIAKEQFDKANALKTKPAKAKARQAAQDAVREATRIEKKIQAELTGLAKTTRDSGKLGVDIAATKKHLGIVKGAYKAATETKVKADSTASGIDNKINSQRVSKTEVEANNPYRTFADLLATREAINDFSRKIYGKSNHANYSALKKAKSYVENKIKEGAKTMPSNLGKSWLKQYEVANTAYRNMKTIQEYDMYKVIRDINKRKAASPDEKIQSIATAIAAEDPARYKSVMTAFTPQERINVEFASLLNATNLPKNALVMKDGNKIVNWVGLSKYLEGTLYTTNEAKDAIRAINEMARIWKVDPEFAALLGRADPGSAGTVIGTSFEGRARQLAMNFFSRIVAARIPMSKSAGKLALVKTIGRVLDNPTEYRSYTELLSMLDNTSEAKSALDDITSRYMNRGEVQDYSNITLYSVKLKGGDNLPRETSLGRGMLYSAKKPDITSSRLEMIKTKYPIREIATQDEVKKIIADISEQVGEVLTIKDLSKKTVRNELVNALIKKGKVGYNIGEKVLIFSKY